MEIRNFDLVIIENNSLIALDIDETLIYFENISPQWWNNTFNKYYKITNDYDKADILSLNEWENLIHELNVQPIDIDGLNKFLDNIYKSNSNIILITARKLSLKSLTLLQLQQCKINIPENCIYFTEQKGKFLQEFNIENKNLIFIDDLQSNIDDVQFYNPNSTCYLANFLKK